MQACYLAQAAGIARFAYNWALAEWQRQYQASLINPALPKPNEAALRRRLNAIKRTEFPWMLEVTKNVPQMAIMQLGRAFDNFFARRARSPTFRRKGRDDRFTLSNDLFRVQEKRIRIPKLGWVRMRESLRFAGPSSRLPFRAMLVTGLPASPSTCLMLYLCRQPKTKARSVSTSA